MSRTYRGKRQGGFDRATVLLLAGIVVTLSLVLVACTYLTVPGGEGPADQSQAEGDPRKIDMNGDAPAQGGQPEEGSGEHAPDGAPEEPAEPEQERYDFSQPAPEGEAVDNSYFADAAFVGDSRTDGFMIYSGIGCGKNLTSNGLSIFKLGEKKALTIGEEKYTLLEALALEQYGKVYLSLGVNELGYYNDQGFYDSYCKAIDEIRAIQPNAVIYIQGLIPLNEEQIANSTGRTYLTNEHLRVYNDLMRQAAEEKQVVYLDLYSQFVDENGALPADASKDGVHLNKEYCQRWLEYLKTHTVDFDTLYPEGAPAADQNEDGSGQA